MSHVSDPDDDTQAAGPDPSIELVKTGTLNDDDGTPGVSAGDTISYAFSVTNDGNVTLTGVTLADTVGGVTLSGGPIATPRRRASSMPPPSRGSYTLTQVDVDAGTFTNTATVTGTDPNDDAVSDPDDDTQAAGPDARPSTLVKTSTTTTVTTPGQVVPYSYLLTNTGNVTISDLSVSDDNVDADPVCVATTLAPGELDHLQRVATP